MPVIIVKQTSQVKLKLFISQLVNDNIQLVSVFKGAD